uniref:Uncharacterized protein n=1 Tax=Arundo donax TaxID=35708 RepID=A0A0A9AIP3_ARUDO
MLRTRVKLHVYLGLHELYFINNRMP